MLEKLPEDIKLQVTRFISSEIWDLRELLELLTKEVEAREKCAFLTTKDKVSGQTDKHSCNHFTTASFVNKVQEKGCVFCSGNHSSHKCSVVQSPNDRKTVLMQNGRCFRCLSAEHQSWTCKAVKGCFRCGRNHHQAICFQRAPNTRATGNNSVNQNWQRSSRPAGGENQTHAVKADPNWGRNWQTNSGPAGAENQFRTEKVSLDKAQGTSSSLCSSSGSLVLLETAVTMVSNGADGGFRGRILLDKCSQQSYVTEAFADSCGLRVVRRKAFGVNAFGSMDVQQVEKNVYEACIKTLFGQTVVHLVGMKTICSPLLSSSNVHAVKGQYGYLSNLQLAEDFQDDVAGALSVNIDWFRSLLQVCYIGGLFSFQFCWRNFRKISSYK